MTSVSWKLTAAWLCLVTSLAAADVTTDTLSPDDSAKMQRVAELIQSAMQVLTEHRIELADEESLSNLLVFLAYRRKAGMSPVVPIKMTTGLDVIVPADNFVQPPLKRAALKEAARDDVVVVRRAPKPPAPKLKTRKGKGGQLICYLKLCGFRTSV